MATYILIELLKRISAYCTDEIQQLVIKLNIKHTYIYIYHITSNYGWSRINAWFCLDYDSTNFEVY